MTYADTNFFVALMDPKDALHKEAQKNYALHAGDIETSVLTLAELFHGCETHGLDPEVIAGSVFQMADVSGISLEEAMKAAHYMKEFKMRSFEALHCALAGDQITTGDKDFGKTGIKVIWKT